MRNKFAKQDARGDVSVQIALALQRRNLNAKKAADLSGVTKGRMSQVLSGDSNLQLDTIAQTLEAIGCRFAFVVFPNSCDEWKARNALDDAIKPFWEGA